MARICRTWSPRLPKILTHKYTEARQGSALHNETNDCAVVALALVASVPYSVAHNALKDAGRKDRKGTFRSEQFAALKALGFDGEIIPSEDFISRYPGNHKNLKSVTTHHMDRFNKVWEDGKNYLIFTERHVGAVIDGVNHDWTKNKSRRVWSIVEIVKA